METTEKRKRGRPPIENPETARFELRLTPERLAEYKASAARRGMALATWIKSVLDRSVRRG